MAKKKKKIAWHKKKGKFISNKYLKKQSKSEDGSSTSEKKESKDKMKNFALKLNQEIKKALE